MQLTNLVKVQYIPTTHKFQPGRAIMRAWIQMLNMLLVHCLTCNNYGKSLVN